MSDALPAYKSAYKAEFISDVPTKTENPPTRNFASGIRGLVDNNIMERVNNTLRGRERNYRGLNVDDSPMIPPSKAAGIDLKLGHDKRNGLIKQAHKYKKTGGKIRIWEKD